MLPVGSKEACNASLRHLGRAVMQKHPQAVRQINRLAGLLTAEEIRIARQTIQAWGEGQRVPQLYVVREGD